MLDWNKLKPYKTSKEKSFEQLCFQLAVRKFGHLGVFTPIDDSGGGDGVEFYLTLANGEEWVGKPNQTKQKITSHGLSLFKNGDQADVTWPIKFWPGTTELLRPIIEHVDLHWRIAATINGQQGHSLEIVAFQHGATYVEPFLILSHL